MCDENHDYQAIIDKFHVDVPNPVEPLELKFGELEWNTDKYTLSLRDAEFRWHANGPGETDEITPRDTFAGEKTRIRRRPAK